MVTLENSKPIVKLEEVSVYYRFATDRPTSMKEFVIRTLKRQIERQTVKALNGVSLEVYKGEAFGVIGRNGAGKSTLLKALARIIRPTHGRIRIWGPVTSLLSVGAGFSHELTGRENIFLYSALLGRSRSQTESLFENITSFAELNDFIDAPLRTYSTGMVARLGFAVAMADRPEILLVDEVLGVGDTYFQEKCMMKFHEYRENGTTLILVSHNLPQVVQNCETSIWLHNGVTKSYGHPTKVAADYERYQNTISSQY